MSRPDRSSGSTGRGGDPVDVPVRLLQRADPREPIRILLQLHVEGSIGRDQPDVRLRKPAGRQRVWRVHLADQVLALDVSVTGEYIRDLGTVARYGQSMPLIGRGVVPLTELHALGLDRLPLGL